MIRIFCGNIGCLEQETLIKILKKGKICINSLKNLPKEFTIITKNIKTKTKSYAKAIKINSGIKDVFRIHFSDKDYVDATVDHKFFTTKGKEITVGEILNLNRKSKQGEGIRQRVHLMSDNRHNLYGKNNSFYGKKHTYEVRKKLHELNFKTGIHAYNRPFMREQLPKCCEVCGKNKKTHVHHIDENRKNNIFSNLQVLCVKCHATKHEWGKKKK